MDLALKWSNTTKSLHCFKTVALSEFLLILHIGFVWKNSTPIQQKTIVAKCLLISATPWYILYLILKCCTPKNDILYSRQEQSESTYLCTDPRTTKMIGVDCFLIAIVLCLGTSVAQRSNCDCMCGRNYVCEEFNKLTTDVDVSIADSREGNRYFTFVHNQHRIAR